MPQHMVLASAARRNHHAGAHTVDAANAGQPLLRISMGTDGLGIFTISAIPGRGNAAAEVKASFTGYDLAPVLRNCWHVTRYK